MKSKLFFLINMFFLFVLFFLKPNIRSVLSSELLTVYSLLFLGSVVMHFFNYNRTNKSKNWFRLDVFFLLGFTIVHFQWPIMYGISNIFPANPSYMWGDDLYVNYAAWLSSVGGISWIFGFSFLKTKAFRVNQFRNIKYSNLMNFTIVLFILFLITVDKDFLTGGVYKGSGGSHTGEGVSAYIQLVFSIAIILLTGVIIIENKKKYDKNLLKWFFNLDLKFLFLYFSYILLFLLIGDRGGPVKLILTTAILVGTLVKPIKLPILLISILAGGALLTVISLGRSEKSGIGILSAGTEKFELTSGYDMTLELANSFRALNMSLRTVPENHDFFYGKLWKGSFLAIIPFSQSIYLSLTDGSPYELSSADYITFITLGPYATSGEGTSLIADIYLNFGVYGVLIIMFLAGLLFQKIDVNLRSLKSINWFIIGVVLVSFSFSLGRNSFFDLIRPIIWSTFLLLLFVRKKL